MRYSTGTHNCDPFVFGPEFAMLKIPLPNVKKSEVNSTKEINQNRPTSDNTYYRNTSKKVFQ